MAIANQRIMKSSPRQTEDIALSACQARVAIDGKFFARGARRLRVQGVTYGPFAPNKDGEPFPAVPAVRGDFARMKGAGINSVRTYHVPPEWLFDVANEYGLFLLVDIPWPKHLCFLQSQQARAEVREYIRQVAKRGQKHPSLLAYSIGNEIPPDIVRWHGRRRVERFLAELTDIAKQQDPDGLITYANFPPTEYLDLPFLDFATFNVYLHDRETFRRYLFRLHNLVGDKPLILGELGMDSFRHGELEQAHYLAGHVREALLTGLAGIFVFSWTDDWFTGGSAIEDWAFGITHTDRLPKASVHALREVFQASSAALLSSTPRVSVIVCSYNGGATLQQCLNSLSQLEYPDYEVIVVDDGSTDQTRAILARFPAVRVIHQPNRGLSAARNAGLQAATGSIVAYTDADCYADPDWITQLVHQLKCTQAAGVGGPNLSPEDGRQAACVAASPGQPTHVLESHQVAEHIPGCNMAFRREALLGTKGFDPVYRKAGDDVDICWRLQQAGYWITFAPGAVVWHHRRQSPRAYLRQQAGYGEAEALLRFKHPDKFNGRGDGKWRGVLYGSSLRGLQLAGPIIYHGTFGTGLFQCLYKAGPAHWAMFPATLEWHFAVAAIALVALFWWPAWIGVGGLLTLSLLVAALQAAQAHLAPEHVGLRSRLLILALCYIQPLIRSWWRYRTRLFKYHAPVDIPIASRKPLSLMGRRTVSYWSDDNVGRLQLLRQVLLYLDEHRWGKTIDTGWSNWDLEIYCHPWTVVQVCTAQEHHGGGKHLIRVRFRSRTSGAMKATGLAAAWIGMAAGIFWTWPAALAVTSLIALYAGLWWRGVRKASQAVAIFDTVAGHLKLSHCDPMPGQECETRMELANVASLRIRKEV
jgi:GT2 family glycosyltransferase